MFHGLQVVCMIVAPMSNTEEVNQEKNTSSGGKYFLVFLCIYSTIQLWHCVSFLVRQEIVFGVTYTLRVQFRCAAVSVSRL
jgi:hypothetical protein